MLERRILRVGRFPDGVLVQRENVRAGRHLTPPGMIVRPLHRLQFLLDRELLPGLEHQDLHPLAGENMSRHATGGAGSDDDQMLGEIGQVVQLTPRQDPLAVRKRIGQLAGPRARRDQHDVGVENLLGTVGLGFAYILYFALITGAGASRALLVTYLVPPMALFYGATVLGESFDAVDVLGLVVILAGVALGTGTVQPFRRRRAAGVET